MQALHRLAGVQETSDSSTQPAAPVSASARSSIPAPPPIPGDDGDDVDTQSQSSRRNRASLPLNRRPSHKSFRSTRSRKSVSSTKRNESRDNLALPSDYPPTPHRSQYTSTENVAHQDDNAPPVPEPESHQQSRSEPAAARTSAETGMSHASVDDEDFTWGPSHPCFPHPNPHCSPTSPEYEATRVIRVKRDWLAAGDLYPQYANLYPEILEPLVSDSEFRLAIANINSILKRTHSPYTSRAWVDSLLGAFTGYIWEDLGWTGAKKGEKELERFIEQWNAEREKEGREVKLIQLRKTGFMSLDFVVPDPGIDLAKSEQEDEGEDMRAALQSGPNE